MTLTSVATELIDSPSLLLRAQQGDADAFCELCRIHESRLLRQATALCGNGTLAEDLAQDTLIQAWKCIRRYNGQCQFFTWLCALLLNRFRNVLRQKRPVTFSSLPGAEREGVQSLLENFPDTGNRPDQATELLERAAFLRECIRKLPEKQRDVVYLRFYVDHSLESIALALGCSLGTVKSRLFHALDRLRAMNELNSRVGQLDHNL